MAAPACGCHRAIPSPGFCLAESAEFAERPSHSRWYLLLVEAAPCHRRRWCLCRLHLRFQFGPPLLVASANPVPEPAASLSHSKPMRRHHTRRRPEAKRTWRYAWSSLPQHEFGGCTSRDKQVRHQIPLLGVYAYHLTLSRMCGQLKVSHLVGCSYVLVSGNRDMRTSN